MLWLLNGKGIFPKGEYNDQEKTDITPISKIDMVVENDSPNLFSNPITTTVNEKNPVFENISKNFSNMEVLNNVRNNMNDDSDIDQIVIFYKDGTFKTYTKKNPNLK